MKNSFLFLIPILCSCILFSCNNDDDSSNSNNSIIGKWATQKVGSVTNGEEVFTTFYDWSDEPCGMNYDTDIWADGTLIGSFCISDQYNSYTTTWSLNGTSLILGDNICTLKEVNAEYMKTHRIMTSGEIQVKVYKRIE